MNNTIQIYNKTKTTNLFKISRAHNHYALIGLVLIIIIQIGLWYSNLWHPIVLSSFLIFGFVWIKYTKEFGDILSRTNKKLLIQLINSNFNKISYYPNKHIFKNCFIVSELYDFSSFIFKGSNLIKGDGWFFSNIQVSLPISKNNNYLTIFDGIFAKIKIQNNIGGSVIIKPLPVKDKTVIPEILQHLIHRYYTPRVNSSATGNIFFDERFQVFTSPGVTQNKIINEKLMKNVLAIDETINYYFGKEYTGMELSFINNYIYIGIKGIKLFSTDGSFDAEVAQKYMEIIKQITNINKQ